MLALALLSSGCYMAALVTLTPGSAGELAVDGGPGRLTDADVQRAEQITKEIAAHFGFVEDTTQGLADREIFASLRERNLANYSDRVAGLVYITLHLAEDRSYLHVGINALSNSTEGSEIVRRIRADFERMFAEAFPGYAVTLE